MSNNLSESDNNLEQADTSNNNANQIFYLNTKNLILSLGQNNLLSVPNNTISIIEFDLVQSSPLPQLVANDIFLTKSAN